MRQALTLRVRLREHEPHAVLRSLHAHGQLFRGQRSGFQRPAARQGTRDPRTVPRQAAARTVHRRNSSCRSTTRRRRRATICARRSSCSSEAGWVNKGGKLVNEKTGEQFKIEFLGNDPTDERVTAPFIENLRKLGIDATLRIVDPSQYINAAADDFDFDIDHGGARAVARRPATSSAISGARRPPTRPARATMPASRTRWSTRWSSASSSPPTATISSPRRMRSTACCCGTTTSCRTGTIPKVWLAYWNKFGMPEKQPSYIGVDIDSWWIDPAKEAALAAKIQERQLMAGAAGARPPRLPGAVGAAHRRAAAAAAGLRRQPDRHAAARPVGLRRPEISGRISRISTTSMSMRRRAARSTSARRTGCTTRTPTRSTR